MTTPGEDLGRARIRVKAARGRDAGAQESVEDREIEGFVEGRVGDDGEEIAGAHGNDEIDPAEWDWKAIDDAVFAQFNFRLASQGGPGSGNACFWFDGMSSRNTFGIPGGAFCSISFNTACCTR